MNKLTHKNCKSLQYQPISRNIATLVTKKTFFFRKTFRLVKWTYQILVETSSFSDTNNNKKKSKEDGQHQNKCLQWNSKAPKQLY